MRIQRKNESLGHLDYSHHQHTPPLFNYELQKHNTCLRTTFLFTSVKGQAKASRVIACKFFDFSPFEAVVFRKITEECIYLEALHLQPGPSITTIRNSAALFPTFSFYYDLHHIRNSPPLISQ